MGHVLCVHARGKNWWLAYLLCNCLQMKTVGLWEYHDAFVPDHRHPLWWHYQRQQEWDVPFLIVFMSYLSPFVWLVIFIFSCPNFIEFQCIERLKSEHDWFWLCVIYLKDPWVVQIQSWCSTSHSCMTGQMFSPSSVSVHSLQLYEVFFEMTKARIVCFVFVVFVFLFDFPPFQFVKSVHIVSSHNDLKKCMIFLQKHHVRVVNIFCDHDTIKWHPWGGVASFFAAIWCLLSCKKWKQSDYTERWRLMSTFMFIYI